MPSTPDRDAAWLVEIDTAIRTIGEYTQNFDENAFLTHRLVNDAAAMQLIVIGEAAGNLSEEAKNEAPEIPWRRIIALRNRIAHGYRHIDHRVIWGIIHGHLPPLAAAVRRMLKARGE